MNKVPANRYKEFASEWNTYSLGDVITEFYNGQTPYRGKLEYWSGSVNWLASGDLNRGIIYQTTEKISEIGKNAANLRLIPRGTVVIAIMGLEAARVRGNCGLLGIDTTINQACMAIYPNLQFLLPEFFMQWYQFVGDRYGQIYTQGTKQQNYNTAILANLSIKLPLIQEQEKISVLIKKIDYLIALNQAKFDKLVCLKKAMLQKVFPRDGATVPEIRFNKFEGEWEEKSFGELYTSNKERNEGRFPIEKTLSVASMRFNPEGNGGNGAYFATYKVLRVGDIAFEGNKNNDFRYGRFVLNDLEDGIMSPRFPSLRPIVEQDIGFWKYYIHCESVMKSKLAKAIQSGTLMSELVPDDFFKQTILVPSIPEQKKIGEYLEHLDKFVSLQQVNLEKLKNTKKSLLARMFI